MRTSRGARGGRTMLRMLSPGWVVAMVVSGCGGPPDAEPLELGRVEQPLSTDERESWGGPWARQAGESKRAWRLRRRCLEQVTAAEQVTAEPEANDSAEAADAGVGATAPEDDSSDIVARSQLAIHGVAGQELLSEEEVWDRIGRQRALCFGELHDDPYHHNAQLRGLDRWSQRQGAQGRHWRRVERAVGFEMFQRPFQEPLTDYVRGKIGEEEFLEATEYPTRWGYDFALYRPLLELTGERRARPLALNAPTELTRQIGREGLESLSPEQAAQVPELDLEDEEHRAYIFSLFGITPAHPSASSLENIYTAQVVWDETMAETGADWLRGGSHRERRRLFTLAGVAHCHRSAIPRRFERRTEEPMLSVAAVHQAELDGFPEFWTGYDLLVVLEPPLGEGD